MPAAQVSSQSVAVVVRDVRRLLRTVEASVPAGQQKLPANQRSRTGGKKRMAYHSSNPSDPDVYHTHEDCPSGQQIPSVNRVEGQGTGNRLCEHCEDLG